MTAKRYHISNQIHYFGMSVKISSRRTVPQGFVGFMSFMGFVGFGFSFSAPLGALTAMMMCARTVLAGKKNQLQPPD
jgi:hypothetical protein